MHLTPKPLTPKSFALYGEVIDTQSAATQSFKINYGLTTRFHDMATIDVSANQGRAGFSIFQAQKTHLPHRVKVMEYHPCGSQLFYPLCDARFLILVAPAAERLDVNKLELFISNGKQGVNYHKGTWHHYLLPLEDKAEFIVIDRIADDKNCVEEKVDGVIVGSFD